MIWSRPSAASATSSRPTASNAHLWPPKAGGQLTLHDLKRTLNIQHLSTIPNHYGVVADSVNQGVPVSRIAPRSPVTLAIHELASSITGQAPVDAGSAGIKGMLGKFFDKRGDGVSV